MDFLDNVKNVVGSAAQTVVKKSGEVVEYSKIKYSMYDTGNTIRDLYARIGEVVYKGYKNGNPLDDSIKDICAQIDELDEKLDVLEEQLDGIKSAVKCGSCGKNVKDSCTYCPYCGEKLAKDVEVDFGDVSGTEYYSPSASEPESPLGDTEPKTEDTAGE